MLRLLTSPPPAYGPQRSPLLDILVQMFSLLPVTVNRPPPERRPLLSTGTPLALFRLSPCAAAPIPLNSAKVQAPHAKAEGNGNGTERLASRKDAGCGDHQHEAPHLILATAAPYPLCLCCCRETSQAMRTTTCRLDIAGRCATIARARPQGSPSQRIIWQTIIAFFMSDPTGDSKLMDSAGRMRHAVLG